jgi:NADH dehydrogenase FAD-containing subunit
MQSGRHCAAQILLVLESESTKPFKYRNEGTTATIGRHVAATLR